MPYIELRGHKVWSRQWRRWRSEPILLLHGGLSTTESFSRKVLPSLKKFRAFAYDRTAHGRTPMRKGFYHFQFQTDEAISYIEDVIKGPTHIIGHSDGGIIALMVAIQRPDLVQSIVPIGANYHFNCDLNLDTFPVVVSEEDKDAFHERTGQPRDLWVAIVTKAHEVWKSEPQLHTRDLKKIAAPTLVVAGDDEPFANEHTVSLYESIPNSRLAIVPGTSHSVLSEKPELIKAILKDFYRDLSYPLTRNPNRRREETERILGVNL